MEPTDNEIQEVVQSTWFAFLQADATPIGTSAEVARDGAGKNPLLGRIDIDGAWRGEVLFRCQEQLGRTAAAVFFDLPPDAIGEAEICDAVAELTNVLGGNLKCLLPSGCKLSLPHVDPLGGGGAEPPSGAVAFQSGGEPFWVAVRRRS